jgi:hypothetical protein
LIPKHQKITDYAENNRQLYRVAEMKYWVLRKHELPVFFVPLLLEFGTEGRMEAIFFVHLRALWMVLSKLKIRWRNP